MVGALGWAVRGRGSGGRAREATGVLCEAAEQVDILSEGLPRGITAKLTASTTAIYEASGFQDITGQRISKVQGFLKEIEDKVAKMTDAIGYQPDPDAPPSEPAPGAAPRAAQGELEDVQSSALDPEAVLVAVDGVIATVDGVSGSLEQWNASPYRRQSEQEMARHAEAFARLRGYVLSDDPGEEDVTEDFVSWRKQFPLGR